MLPSYTTTGAATWEILEGSIAAGGTDKTCINRRRDSGNTSGNTSVASTANAGTTDATITDYDTLICSALLGAKTSAGGEAREDSEWVLAPNTQYTFAITSTSANNRCFISLNWYEHVDED